MTQRSIYPYHISQLRLIYFIFTNQTSELMRFQLSNVTISYGFSIFFFILYSLFFISRSHFSDEFIIIDSHVGLWIFLYLWWSIKFFKIKLWNDDDTVCENCLCQIYVWSIFINEWFTFWSFVPKTTVGLLEMTGNL